MFLPVEKKIRGRKIEAGVGRETEKIGRERIKNTGGSPNGIGTTRTGRVAGGTGIGTR